MNSYEVSCSVAEFGGVVDRLLYENELEENRDGLQFRSYRGFLKEWAGAFRVIEDDTQ